MSDKATEKLKSALTYCEAARRAEKISLVKLVIKDQIQPDIEQALSLLQSKPEQSEAIENISYDWDTTAQAEILTRKVNEIIDRINSLCAEFGMIKMGFKPESKQQEQEDKH